MTPANLQVRSVMKTRRVTRSAGTPAELAGFSTGYASSGESQFTRRISGGAAPKFSGSPSRARGAGIERTLTEKIGYERARLRKLQIDIGLETNPTRRAKLERDEDIKANFLARLIAEQQGDRP
jgi:hypothetical protein